jgi:hypothetical protein
VNRSGKQQGDPILKRKGALIGQWRDLVLSNDGPADPNAKLVALAVAKFINAQSMQTFAGVDALAEATGYDERTVRRHLTKLLAAGWLFAEYGPSKGFITHRFLRLRIPTPAPGKSPADTQGRRPAATTGESPADAADKTPAEATTRAANIDQRAICPPTAGNDDSHRGQFAQPPRANCPPNSVNPFNPSEHGAQARRLTRPAQGERSHSETAV